MKHKRVLAGSVCLAALLCACAGRGQTPALPAGSPAPAATATPLELAPLQDAEGTVYGAAGPDGYYSVVSTARADGSLNIRYTDYASMQTVYLCAQPNCAHDSESCTGYQPGGSGVSLMMAGGQLVLVSPGTGPWGEQPSPPRVCVCGPDGSRRRQAASFEANQQLDGPYLTDGKNLYAALRTVQAQTATEELVCIDLGSGAVSTVLPLDTARSERVRSAVGEHVLLVSLDEYDQNSLETGRSCAYKRVNVNTLERETVLEYSTGEGRAVAFGDALVFYDAEQNSILSIDWRTGQRQLLAREVLPAGADMLTLNLCFYDEGRVLYSFEAPGSETYPGGRVFFAAGPEETQKTEFSLTYPDMERPLPVNPIAKTGGSYFVIAGETLQPREDRREDGTLFTANIPEPVYGKIRCEDFWAGSGPIETAR